jgi:general secretion pathway protein D
VYPRCRSIPDLILAAAAVCMLGGCYQPVRLSDVHTRQTEIPAARGSIPAPVALAPAVPKPGSTPRPETYSVVVNQVPVQQLLFALARDAKVNVDIYPGLQGSVTLNAVDQTLPQILDRLSKQLDMRWELDGPNLSIMPDTPYLRLYKIDYVNMDRSTQGTVAVSGQIANNNAGGTGMGAAGGATGVGGNTSNVIIRNTQANRFWTTLVKNVQDLLHETDKILPAGTSGAAAPAGPSAAELEAVAGMPGGDRAGLVEQLAAARLAAMPKYREAAAVIANPESGVISIRATGRQHARIQEFLDKVMASATRQVLIEGTIVEVSLNNQYQQGIDWSVLRSGSAGFNVGQGGSGTSGITNILNNSLTASPTGAIFAMNYSSQNFKSTLNLLESFGTVRVLSSPRISVVNNQTAVLKVVDNLVYFTVTSQIAAATAVQGALQSFTTTPNVMPVGFVMNVTPQISDNDTVLLDLKPTITRLLSYVNDPNPSLAQAGVISQVPQIQTREMESVIRLTNGQLAVMGGLIEDSVNDAENSIPGLNRLPVLGNAFGNQTRQNTKTELIIFLRPIAIHDPSLEGDFRGYKVLLPDNDFLSRPNPGKRILGESGTAAGESR